MEKNYEDLKEWALRLDIQDVFEISTNREISGVQRSIAYQITKKLQSVEKASVECKQTWYEVWVARVNKVQLHDYIEYCYGSDPCYTDPDRWLVSEGSPYLVERLNAVREFVSGLDDKEQYALVAMEVY